MSHPRVVFLGAGGPFACLTLERLVKVGDIAAVVVPRARGRGLRQLPAAMRQRYATRHLRRIAGEHQIPVVIFGTDLRQFKADLLCTASFPHIVPPDMRAAGRLGAINVHSSLLPRHRGPDPIFWTYFDDDRTTGVTVHRMTDGVDDGDVIVQREVSVPRGMSGVDLYLRLANEAAEAMATAVSAIGNGTADRRPQGEGAPDPHPMQMTWRVDYASWPAERLQHFLAGYAFRKNAQLADGNGTVHSIGEVLRVESASHEATPGTFESRRGELKIHLANGAVVVRQRRSWR
jgi:methionyl-tRNA formyltransferase